MEFVTPGGLTVEVQNLYVAGILALIGALYYGLVAARKGRNGLGWALLGAVMANVALLATSAMTAYDGYVGANGLNLGSGVILALLVVLIVGPIILPLWGEAKPATTRGRR